MMNNNCQPWNPAMPSRESSAVDSGAPNSTDIGNPRIKMAVARARSRAGNHRLIYRIMPGKNPASATPSMKRMT